MNHNLAPSSPNRLPAFFTYAFAAILGASVFVALFLTLDDYGYTIDEATYLWAARQGRTWFQEVPELGMYETLSEINLARRWHFLETPEKNTAGHSNFNLPVAVHVANLGWLVGHRATSELDAARLGSVILFSITVAATFLTLSHVIGKQGAFVSSLALAATPRIWGHTHIAATETPLSCLWILTCLALIRLQGVHSARQLYWKSAQVAILVSLTMSAKLTGWFLLPAVLVWLVLYRPLGWKRTFTLCVLMPFPVIVGLTPVLWHHPLQGLWEYLRSAGDNPWTIATVYLGEGYATRLSGASGLVILGVTMPIAWLCLGLFGLVAEGRRPSVWTVGLPTIVLFGARLGGLIPTHDVDRQFLPVYYGVAVLAGFGWQGVLRGVTHLWHALLRRTAAHHFAHVRRVVFALVLPLILIEPLADAWIYRAHGLSHYNRLVGGLPGAADLGFEISYWYEAATDDVWRWLTEDLPANTRVFLRPDHPGLGDLREWGVWREDLQSVGPGEEQAQILYAKRAAYMTPVEGLDRLAPTDLGVIADQGPMDKEVRFLGVRLVGLRTLRP